jgi:hypothetical protein
MNERGGDLSRHPNYLVKFAESKMKKTAPEMLDYQYLAMRERVLSLAADFDRIQRSESGSETLATDPRIDSLKACLELLLARTTDRAAAVQMILSDTTPPPSR